MSSQISHIVEGIYFEVINMRIYIFVHIFHICVMIGARNYVSYSPYFMMLFGYRGFGISQGYKWYYGPIRIDKRVLVSLILKGLYIINEILVYRF